MPEPAAPIPPQNLDAEESVLGAMMLSATAIDVVTEIVGRGDFYRESHAMIFDACVALHNAGSPVDALTVRDRLSSDHGDDPERDKRIHEIASLVAATTNAAHYAVIVRKYATRRGLINVGGQIERLGWDGPDEPAALVERAEGLVFELAKGRATTDFVPLTETMGETVQRLVDVHESGREIVGVPSGFQALDTLTSGFQPANLIVIAARPSMGKSALATMIGTNVAFRQGLPVVVFTLEMSRYEIAQRMISAEALVESQKLRNGRMDREEWRRVMDWGARLGEIPLLLDDNRMISPTAIRSKCRRLKLRHPNLALIIVDYLQLMSSSTDNRVNEIAQISRSLKILAGELEVPVVALSQLSREVEKRHDKRPQLSDLRDSGAIEQDADLVLFIYRDEVYNAEDTDQQGIAELILAKHRNGPIGTVKVAFVKRFARFSELPRGGAGDVR